jgi:hypothetical protein
MVPKASRVFRFRGTTGSSYHIYRENMLSLLCVNGTNGSTTSVVYLINAIRIKRVVLWGVKTSVDDLQEISLTWSSPRSPDVEVSRSGNFVHPAHLDVRPPADSLAGMWSKQVENEDEKLFSMTITAGTIIDIHVDYVLAWGAGGAINGTTSAALSAYSVAFSKLDGLDGSGAAGANEIDSLGPYNTGLATRG